MLGDSRVLFGHVLEDALGEPVEEPFSKAVLVAKMLQSRRLYVQRLDEFDGCGGGLTHAPLVLDLGLGVGRRDDSQVVATLVCARLAERVVEHKVSSLVRATTCLKCKVDSCANNNSYNLIIKERALFQIKVA